MLCTVGKLAFDGLNALFPEVHVDVTANEAVLAHGCGTGSPVFRRVAAALVDGCLLASGGEVLRDVVVSAAVHVPGRSHSWWRGFVSWP